LVHNKVAQATSLQGRASVGNGGSTNLGHGEAASAGEGRSN